MRISILGCGWLGLPLASYLVQQGHQVKGSTTREEKLPLLTEAGIEAFQIQLIDEDNIELIEATLSDDFFESDVLFLNVPPGRNSPGLMYYPQKMQAVLNKVNASPIQWVIFASSTSVYGPRAGTMTEESSLLPATQSGKLLVESEHLVQSGKGFDSTILRFGGLIGGSRKPGRFFAGKADLPNGGMPVNLIHLADCIQIVEHVLLKDVKNIVLNVVSPEHPTRAEFYPLAAASQGLDAPLFAPDPTPTVRIINSDKLISTLQYSFLKAKPKDWLSS